MGEVPSTIGEGFKQSFLMAYEVWWALVLGFAISAIVQAWVPRERIESALAGSGVGSLAKATGLGAASSSCSYAAIAIARSLFVKGASAVTALAFQFASTNLVWELGLVLWILIGVAVHARRPDRPPDRGRVPQVLRVAIRHPDHRADVRDHGGGGAGRRRAVLRRRP